MRPSRLVRPSPALVISIIALFMAMVGTGYAAFKLPKNSVGSKQVKKNAITGAKVKNQSLTGKDIKLSTLGTVPHATLADTIPPVEATHLVGAAGEPGFQAGSGNTPAETSLGFRPVGFFKDHEGIVHLQGMAKVGSSGPAGFIFTLPAGYRPGAGTILIVNVFCAGAKCTKDGGGDSQSYAALVVAGSNTAEAGTVLDGEVIGPEGAIVSLDGVTYKAES